MRDLLCASVVVFFPLLLILLGLSLFKRLDHDEHQFIASAALLARRGLLPYRDYPYFHMPHTVFVYAALFRLSDHLLLAARAFNSACGAATLALLFAVTLHLFRDYGPRARYVIAACATGVLMFNPIFAFTSGKAWNHDLPTLLTLVALLCLWGWRRASLTEAGWRPALWIAAAGALFGLAVGIRLTFAPAFSAFVLAIVFARPPAGGRVRAVIIFSAVAAIALLPAWWLLALAPRPFFFGNFTYPALNTTFRRNGSFSRAMTPLGKFIYLFTDLLPYPGVLILVVLFTAALPCLRRDPSRPPHPRRFETISLALLVGTLLIGSFAATPLWLPYFFAPLPFVALFVVCAVADPRKDAADQARTWKWLTFATAVTVVCGLPAYRTVVRLPRYSQWVPVQLHELGQQLARDAGTGTVLTYAPLIPLEGRCDIYEQFATGPFAARIADMVDERDKPVFHEVDSEDLPPLLAERPPTAVFLGFEHHLEKLLRDEAQHLNLKPLALDDPTEPARKLELWCRSDSHAPPPPRRHHRRATTAPASGSPT